MSFDFPLGMYLDVQNQKRQNLQDTIGNIAGIGQGLGQGMEAIAGAIKERNQKKMINDLINKLLSPQGGQPAAPPPMDFSQMSLGQAGLPPQPNPQMSMVPKPPMPTPPPQTPNQFQGPPGVDPVMQALLPFVKADPSLLPSLLPAIAKGEYVRSRPGKQGGTDYQWASLAERQKEFGVRQKMQGDIQAFRQQMDSAILSLRKAGFKVQADKLENSTKEWIANHWFLSNVLGMGPTDTSAETASADTEEPEVSDFTVTP